MEASLTEILSAGVFVASLVKAVWDFYISKAIFNKKSAGKTGRDLTREGKNKRDRDDIASGLTFALLAAASLATIIIGLSSKEVSYSDFEELSKRVVVLESATSEASEND